MFNIVNTVLFIIIVPYTVWLLTKRKRKKGEPPIVPFWIPYIGCGLQYRKDPIAFLLTQAKKHGSIFTVYMGGDFFTFVVDPFSHPFIAKEGKKLSFRHHTRLLTKKVFNFTRPLDVPTMGGLLPKYFLGEGLNELVETTMNNLHLVVEKHMSKFKQWNESTLHKFSFDLMFHAAFTTLFGFPKACQPPDDMAKIINSFNTFDDVFPLLVQGYPINSLKNAAESRKFLSEVLDIKKRDNVMNMFKEYRDQGNTTPESMSMQSVAILWAAAANTIPSCFRVLYNILKDDNLLQAVRKEVEELIESSGQDSRDKFHLNRQDLEKLPLLDSVVKETLRMCISSSMLRQAVEDIDLRVVNDDRYYRIRKGDKVMALYQLTHYDSEIYEDPHMFKYKRFLSEDGSTQTKFYKKGKQVKYHYQPFGSGITKCPGRLWAVAEIKQFVVVALLRFDVELLKPEEEATLKNDRAAFGVLLSNNKIPIRFRSREL